MEKVERVYFSSSIKTRAIGQLCERIAFEKSRILFDVERSYETHHTTENNY
jgi:hypothetical protein